MTVIHNILIGSLMPLGPRAEPSGIHKTPVQSRVFLGNEGFSGDAQGDRKHHGGIEKAVHHYPYDHYAHWIGLLGNKPVLSRAGAFGENISTSGLTERDVAIGDIFRIGQAIIQVTQGRQPCWKLNIRFDTADMAVKVQKSGMTGWYYKMLETGYVTPREAQLELIDRISPEWTIHRLWHILYVDVLNQDALAAMAALDHLPAGWRSHAQKRLQTGQVESWSRRLHGKDDAAPTA